MKLKRIFASLFMVLLAFALVACDSETEDEENNGNNDWAPLTELPESFHNQADGKHVYVTSIGQAGELSTIDVILSAHVFSPDEETEYNEKVTQKAMLQASEVAEGSIVILVPGASGKGLGAAGTDINGEESRAKAFGARAKAGEITIYVVHLGGDSRRGESDRLITASLEHASLVMIEKEANHDDFFSKLKIENYLEFDAAAAMVAPFKKIFNK